ncbi:hypothetical protein F66182_3144 [Fusarium sp. NRRL 66182]|nr:hypothetical protein F66182_3144 [Fusarium sp. NRRL 66182]
MLSNASVEEAKADIEEKGFHKVDDPEIGSKIDLMRANEQSFYFSEQSGFDFCRDHILLNTYIQGILSALSADAGSQYLLVNQATLAPDQGHIYTLRDGGKQIDWLIVQAWPKNSRVTFYAGSHKADKLQRSPSSNRFWEVAKADLLQNGCKAENCIFDQGGLMIFDARACFEREQERSYHYAYVRLPILNGLLEKGLGIYRKR